MRIQSIEFSFDSEIRPNFDGLFKGATVKVEAFETKTLRRKIVIEFPKGLAYSRKRIREIRNKIEAELIFESILSDIPFKLSASKEVIEKDGIPFELEWATGFSKNPFLQPKSLRDIKGRGYFNLAAAKKKDVEYKVAIGHLLGKERVFRYVIRSYNQGQFDQGNEFFYLYQIHEALVYAFKPKDPWRILGVEKSVWDKLSGITNDVRYTQSRHRGRAFGGEAPASGNTIRRARKAARELIIKYLKYLIKRHSLFGKE